MLHVPNFSEYWGKRCESDRTMDRFVVSQMSDSLNGEHQIFWNVDDGMPEN